MLGVTLFFFTVFSISLFFLSRKYLPIATGFAAKIMASALFIGHRDLADVRKNELKKTWFVKLKVDLKQKMVTGSILGLFKKESRFHPIIGCQLNPSPIKLSLNRINENKSTNLPITYNSEIQDIVKNAFLENDIKKPLNTRAILVVYEGKVIAENYAEGYNKDIPQAGWSLAKSITNAITGVLVKQKGIDIYENVQSDWLKNNQHQYSIDQLLRMEAGLQFADFQDKFELAKMLFNYPDVFDFGQNLVQNSLENFTWRYSSVYSNILSGILKNYFKTQEAYLAFPYQMLFRKLGMHNTSLEIDPSGNFVGSSFVYASPQDYAKFGLLYLNDGKWNGEQILPKGWVSYSHSASEIDKYAQYGAHFWRNAKMPVPGKIRHWPNLPSDLFYASGYQGQNIIIIPSKKTVIVRLGLTFDYERWNLGELVDDILGNLPY